MLDEIAALRRAYDWARKSPDPSNQNGAVVVSDDGYQFGGGCNTFPPGTVPTSEQLQDRDWKLSHIEHAERYALYDTASHWSTSGLILVCPWFACDACARAILLCGIKRVVGHQQRMDTTPERWKASVDAGLNILRRGGVELTFISHVFGDEPILANGQLWVP